MKTRRMFVIPALLTVAALLTRQPDVPLPTHALFVPPEAGSGRLDGVPVFNPEAPGDAAWFSLGAGLNGNVYAIAVAGQDPFFHQDVYAGGEFTDAGGNATADYIARWDGLAWRPLGNGLNDSVYAIAVDGTSVYVGGEFTNAGGDPNADYVARWDGSSWHSLGGGLNDGVRAITVAGSGLYVGGFFTDAGGDASADFIAGWDGSAWHPVGNGFYGGVWAITVDETGTLYIGGFFRNAGGDLDAAHIAYLDGSTWKPLYNGLNGAVYALAAHGDNIYAGGVFTDAGGDPLADGIAVWERPINLWFTLGGHSRFDVRALAAAGRNLYIGSHWSIDRWDGFTWQEMTNYPTTHAIAVGERGVYVGGTFTNLEVNANADHIAGWQDVHLVPPTVIYSRYDPTTSVRQVRLVRADGSNDRTILPWLTYASFPRLSPNRNYIAFLGDGDYPPYHQNNLYVLNLSNSVERRVFTNTDYIVGYDWMNDSRIIVFDYACAIYRMNTDGTQVTPLITGDCYNDAPAVNPIDNGIAFHNQNIGILVADKYGVGVTHVPNTQPGDQWPTWSLDGQWLSFTRGGDLTTHFGGNYFKIHPDGSGLTQLTFLSNDANNRMNPTGAWTSDPAYLVAPGTVNGVTGIYAIRTNGRGEMLRIPAALSTQADFVGAMLGYVPTWELREYVYLPIVMR